MTFSPDIVSVEAAARQAFTVDETALFSVQGDRIVREEFFYMTLR